MNGTRNLPVHSSSWAKWDSISRSTNGALLCLPSLRMLLERNGEIKNVKKSFTILRGVRKDGQLRAAEKSSVFLSVLHQHSQPQLNAVSEVTKSLMKTSSLEMKLWLVSGIRGDELIQGLLKSSRSSHGEVGILEWKPKGHLFCSSATTHTLPNVSSTVWLYTAGEVSSQQACSLVTQVFWPIVIPLLVSSNWHWNTKLTYFSQTLFKLWLFCRKFCKLKNFRVQLVYFWMLN